MRQSQALSLRSGIQLPMRCPRRLGDIVFQRGEIADQNARAGDQNIVMAGAA